MKVINRSGQSVDVSYDAIKERISKLCIANDQNGISKQDIPEDIDVIVIRTITGIYDGIHTSELDELSARECVSLQSIHHGYDTLAGRICMSNLHKNVSWMLRPDEESLDKEYHGVKFSQKVAYIEANQPNIYNDDLKAFVRRFGDKIDAIVDYQRDFRFNFFSVKTLERSYLQKINDIPIESPQDMWMRIAIALHCPRREGSYSFSFDDADAISAAMVRIKETYDNMSLGYFTHATPSLFNLGTQYEQGSSCYLLGTDDSLKGIYKCLGDCAQISKWAGGIGLHISNIRANKSPISSTNGMSDGIIPMLRVFNETGRYCNQSGRRKGSIAIYIEPWHADIWEFVELRRNTGAESERARDLFLALWIPDLFMRAVLENREWYLMSSSSSPGLQDVYGEEFDELYNKYVSEGKYVKSIKARTLWMHVLQCQMETGNPYVMFKDHVNNKCNQKNLGTIRSSNLCAEITEYSDADTYAVCNLASIAVNRFLSLDESSSVPPSVANQQIQKELAEQGGTTPSLALRNKLYARLDLPKLHSIAKQITYNLNRIIDVNFYPTPETQKSNFHSRPIGIGIQGCSDLYFSLGLSYGSELALVVDAVVMETIYHGALEASVELAKLEGPYPSFDGSPFSKGQLQMDLWEQYSPSSPVRYSGLYDWDDMRRQVKQHGTRNSMLTALMPTASTSQILGNNECFEPVHGNIFKRTTLAGEFKVVNKSLMKELMEMGMWDDKMRQDLTNKNGSVQGISAIPQRIKDVYKTVWDVPQRSIIDHAVARGPFVDQSQSMNLFFAPPDSDRLNLALIYAWKKGLKTGMYYHRSRSAVEAINYAAGNLVSCNSVQTARKVAVSSQQRSPVKNGNGAATASCNMEEGCTMCSA